ncbi:MAG: hypothetical protein U5R48_03080 [Gammaproteobacteria bacterium]|nr:hypothetical protein [Gammaproteobacteria bacterium]
MEIDFWTAFGTSLAAAGVTSLGIFTIARFRAWGTQHQLLHVLRGWSTDLGLVPAHRPRVVRHESPGTGLAADRLPDVSISSTGSSPHTSASSSRSGASAWCPCSASASIP